MSGGGATAVAQEAAQEAVVTMPVETGAFRPSELIEITRLDPSIKLDIRYATANNFVGRPVYAEARAFLQRPAAEALVKAHRWLKTQGYGLVVFDGYRPWRVTKLFWELTSPDKRDYVADPAKGSLHNRGCAADVSLYDLKTGELVTMPSEYDEMSERAHPDYAGGTEDQRRLRDLLRSAMERFDFKVYRYEWWHFDYKDWRQYRVQDTPFSEIPPLPVSNESPSSSDAPSDAPPQP
ncbi:MAG: D-alanyl-D-alanine dipeptidase [Chloracidobacterium sp. CP2_5A]|nr:MAG: D-alanyl-D-alanine dipeptidase [Chloracidobacterium sp. CP2_5A]